MRPHLRIGLNTGMAIVGQVQGGADAVATVLGDAVNVASRLQVLAERDSVVMCEALQRFVQRMVETSFVGREREFGLLERILDKARSGPCVLDLAAEPGMGCRKLLFRRSADAVPPFHCGARRVPRQSDKEAATQVVKNIRRATRRHFSADDKIRIVLEGLRGEASSAVLFRHEGIVQNLYYRWSEET